jgi:hypothetical protein
MLSTVFLDIGGKSAPVSEFRAMLNRSSVMHLGIVRLKTNSKAQKFSKRSEVMRFDKADHGKVTSDYEISKVAYPQYSKCRASPVKTRP